MIRTTIRIEEEIFKEARKKAIEQRKPFAKIVSDALREYLKAQHRNRAYGKIKFGAYHIGTKGSLRRTDIYEGV